MRAPSKNRNRGGASSNRDGSAPTEAITLYVTPEDAKNIRAAAKRERLALSAYARRATVQAALDDTKAS